MENFFALLIFGGLAMVIFYLYCLAVADRKRYEARELKRAQAKWARLMAKDSTTEDTAASILPDTLPSKSMKFKDFIGIAGLIFGIVIVREYPEMMAVAIVIGGICFFIYALILITFSPSPSNAALAVSAHRQGEWAGGVYLIRCGPHFKIGKATHFDSRIKRISLQMPYEVVVVHTISTSPEQALSIERYWHQKFAAKRLNGEWFALDETEVAEFRQYSAMTIR